MPTACEGTDAAIVAHIYAHAHQGTVSIVRCWNDDAADAKVQELLHHITMADGYHAPQPEHREIWIVGLRLKAMVHDELRWFQGHSPGRIVRNVKSAMNLYLDCTEQDFPLSLGFFLAQSNDTSSDYFRLRHMLSAEEYEHLVAYLLRKHPTAQDVTKEDYVLSLFVEHERRNNGNSAELSGRQSDAHFYG